MVRDDIKNSSLLKTKFLIYAFNGRTLYLGRKRKPAPRWLYDITTLGAGKNS